MVTVRSAGLALVGTGDAVTLGLLPGRVDEFASRVGHPRAWLLEVGADRALVVTAGAAVWLAAAWLALGLLAALGARLPGAAGHLGARVGRRMLPRALLGLVAGTAGIGVLLAPAAGADPAPSPTPTVSAPSWPLDPPVIVRPVGPPTWPVPAAPAPTASAGTGPSTGPTTRPSTPSHRAPATRPGAPTISGNPVRVRPGDSLWLLAGQRLGPRATDAQIAAVWPRWYAANRDVIGDDPALISPGQVLRSPVPTTTVPTREENR